MRRRIPGKSFFARRAFFLKAGPHQLSKRASSKRRRKGDRREERDAERGSGPE